MALFIPPGSDRFWGEFVVAKKRYRVALNVKVRGLPPPNGNLKLQGDLAFEHSRAVAREAVKQAKAAIQDPEKAKTLAEHICSLAGVKKEEGKKDRPSISPDKLEEFWRTMLRNDGPPSPRHVKSCRSVFTSFLRFLRENHPQIVDLREIDEPIANEFMRIETERGVAGKTFNNNRATLVTAFDAAKAAGASDQNPFKSVPRRKPRCQHRVPYTEKQLQSILTVAADDALYGALVIVAATTGMRRENCIKLRWSSIDLEAGEVKLRAFKTGEEIWFPILPPLHELLLRTPKTSEYCFPDAVTIFQKNPDSLEDGVLRLVRRAGINTEVREAPVEERAVRLRKAPQHGFHVFKTTFITLALNSGIPVEMVRKVVGNSALEVVLDTYYQPAKQAIKDQFNSKLAAVMSGKKRESRDDPVASALRILKSANQETWRGCIDQAVAALKRCSAEF